MTAFVSSRARLVVCALLVSACGGGDGGGDVTAPTEPTLVTLTSSTPTAQPLQAVPVTFPYPAGVAGATLTGDFASKTVSVLLSDSVNGSFLVPSVTPGSYKLTVDFGSLLRGTAMFTVTAASVIADPKAATTAAVGAVSKSADSLIAAVRAADPGALGLSTADADYLAAKVADLQSNLAKASAADLDEFAKFLAANPDVLPVGSASGAPGWAGSTTPAGVSADDISRTVDAFIVAYSSKKRAVVGTIGGCALAITATSWTGIVAALITTGCAASITWQAMDIAALMKVQLGAIYAIPSDMFLDQNALAVAGASSGVGPTMISVDPGETHHVKVRVAFRTISSSDRGVVGALFAAVDEATSAMSKVTKYLPGWAVPNFGPPATAQSNSDLVPGTDVTVTADGCSVTAGGDGVDLTCSQVSTSDVNLTATVKYQNRFGSMTKTLPVTVKKTHAEAGTPVLELKDTFRELSNPADPTSWIRSGCVYTMTIPISGNTPIKFTTWNGVWSRGHTEGGESNYTVDPRQYDGVVWVKDQRFWDGWGNGEIILPWTIDYTINYVIPATGQTGNIWVKIPCAS